MQRYPVLKALSGGQKVFKLAGVGLDRRQGMILVASIFGYWLLYKQLAQAVALSTAQAVVLFFPLVVFAFLLAFAKHDGRHLDWWIQKKAQSRMRPKILKWKRKQPRRKKPLRDSIQEALPAERIAWEMLRTRDGTYVLVFRVDAVSLSLAGDAEKERVWAANAQLYNRLDFPIIEMTRSREGNVATYTQTLREHVTSQVSSEEPDLARFSRQHLEFLENIVPSYNVFDRTGYVILPYKPPGKNDASREKKKPKPWDAARLQREAEEAYRELSNRADIVFDAFMRIGARLQVLTDVELLDFLKGQTSGEDYPVGGAPVLWEPVTLEAGGYGELSPKKLKGVLAVAEKVRREAPPAVGIGDLALADKVSPDAVRINADFLRVGGRYHATLFVYEWPDSVHFGILQSLLHVPGRVKVVKYVKPLPQDKAIGALGSQVAELQAAEHTASDGNVISSQQRAIAHYSAETAMDELISDKQGLFDVSFLVHCEADSKDELHSLVESVRTKLAGIRAEAKLAREEAWEGFVSTLPLGQNLLSKRYANKGMLTNPLACLFVYGSYQVNHPDGILLGVDPVAGGLVVLDSRELMNPHMVILGTSGGGKSQTVKAVSSRLRMRGQRVVVIDPVGDSRYGPVAKALDGEYVVFGVGSPHKFNPCDLRGGYVNLNLLAGAVDEEDPEEASRKARTAALDGKILMLTRLVSLMIASDDGAGGLTTGEQGLVDKLWQEVYAEKGITRDPDTHDREPPTFGDFFRHLANVPDLRHLRGQLYPWESGALRTFFDSQTNVNLDNRYLVLQIAGVSGREKAAIMYALLDFLNGQLSNPDELSNCFIDEFWSLLKYPMAAEFCEELWRSGRARNNAMVGISQDVEEFVHSRHGQVVLRLSATHLILRQRKRTVEVLQDFYDFSEEQRQQVMNLQAGEGYLVVEENQVPLYVICSEHELRLFNTDPKKELEYRRDEQRLLEADTVAGTTGGNLARNGHSHPPGSPNGSVGGEEGRRVTRRLTPVGRTRQLLDDEERPAPAVEDYEEIPYEEAYHPEDGSREDEGPATDEREERIAIPCERGASGDPVVGSLTKDVLHLSVPPSRARPDGAPVYAVVGPTSGLVAYNLAGMLARAGKDEDRRVLFVDAEAYVSEVVLEKLGQERPDELLLRGGDLREYVAHEADSNLFVLMHPEAPGLTAANLVEATRGTFDAVIAACSGSRYARDWLCSADQVVATDSNTRSLETTLKRVEALRGENGTLLAPMGRLKLNPELKSHRVFRLPSAREQAFREAEERAAFATLADEDTRRAFRPLLEELINATREELSHG